MSYSLASGNSATVGCGNCSPPYFDFSMSTDNNKSVSYHLKPTGRYLLFWNQQQSLWDLAEVTVAPGF
jgi:hypothetical protein